MKLAEKLRILGLTAKEIKVMSTIIAGPNTPLLISRKTKVSRPAVYDILKKLKKRELINTNILNGKKYWRLANKEDIDQALYEAKKLLLSISEGTEEAKGLSDGTVIVHRGSEAVSNIILSLAKDHKDERLIAFQGNFVQQGWDTVVGKDKINEFNYAIGKNGIITEAVLPPRWFENHISNLSDKEGLKWAKGFLDRAFAAYQIENEYLNHAGQIFIFKNSLYLMSMNEALVIEIRNSELQKMIKQIFSFVEDHAERIHVNKSVDAIIEKLEKIT